MSFFNLQNHVYWSREENTLDTYYAWRFGTDDGTQLFNLKKRSLYSWAVHDGDIGNPVPLPAVLAGLATSTAVGPHAVRPAVGHRSAAQVGSWR